MFWTTRVQFPRLASLVGKRQRRLKTEYKACQAEACMQCDEVLTLANSSVLKGFCQSCFDAELKKREQDKLDAETLACLAQQAQNFEEKPKDGWLKKPRESEQIWFARVEKSRAKNRAKKQAEYLEMWRQMSQEEKDSWRQSVCPGAASGKEKKEAEPSVEELDAIVAKFRGVSETHSQRAAHPEERWQMYVALARLVQSGYYRSAHACSVAEELKPLCVDRQKLSKTMELVPCLLVHHPFARVELRKHN